MGDKPTCLKWTSRAIEALKVAKRADFTDPDTKGLVLRVTPTGTKTWSFLYRRKSDGEKRRVTIGKFPGTGLSAAREAAEKLRDKVNDKHDPAAGVTAYKAASIVSELLDLFIAEHARPQTAWAKECKRIFNKDVKPLIGAVKLPDLTRPHVRSVLDAVRERGATTTVNRTLAALRRALTWAVENDLLTVNPASNIATNIEEAAKDRALSRTEIVTFWAGLGNAPMGNKSRNALRLALITGQRPGEICGATKSEVNRETGLWLIPAKRAKNRQDHVVPLSAMAKACFEAAIAEAGDSQFVFPSLPRQRTATAMTKPMEAHALSHAMRGSLEQLGLKDAPATPHDLRRTVATHMARLGLSDTHVGRVLNHSAERRRSITSQVYIRHDFLDEKRHSLEVWARELEAIVNATGAKTNVVALRPPG